MLVLVCLQGIPFERRLIDYLCRDEHHVHSDVCSEYYESTLTIRIGSKPEDPYKEKNKEETPLKTKVDDLVAFVDKCKFAMMCTRIESTGMLVSRAMALAAKACSFP